MKPHPPKRQRCAIYTRKSTEHNLDLAFNSLDAQREACEAYIKSQAHEGWTLIKDHFDDGGLSGASLERPALQKLLERVRARDVDVIIVYKVDRLTRSLADFAKLVEEFDAHDVSFVSVTQSFNTTSSMGRLTLNVLLSFAQFEREVIGERVRDKIAASKRKGMWMGGNAPLGYRAREKKLIVEPEEAVRVRKIFVEYLRLGSVAELAAFLDAEGIGPRGGEASRAEGRLPRFGVGALFHLLRNRTYVGEVAYRGENFPGEHEAIIERDLFEAVQQKLGDQAVERRWIRKTSPSLLSGKLFDDRGNAMTPSHANKKGVRYRYYVSQALLQGRKGEAGSVARVSASDVERAVLAGLRQALDADGEAPIANDAFDAAAERASHRDLIERCVVRAVVRRTEITLELKSGAPDEADVDDEARGDRIDKVVSIPFTPAETPRKGIAYAPSSDRQMSEADRKTLLMAIARSCAWASAITRGETDFATIAAQENLVERHVRFLAPLAYLSPRIVEAIAEGRARDLTASGLARNLPRSWSEQERRFGLV